MQKQIRKKNTREIYQENRLRTPPPLVANLILWLHDVRSMHNVGSAFRTADAFGIRSLMLSGFTPAPPRPEIAKTALGADETVPWSYSRDPSGLLTWCRDNDYLIAGMEQTHESKLLTDFHPDPDVKLCLLFGNEVTGLDSSILQHCNKILEIPQFGTKHSFNISVCIGITLYHFLSCHLPS